MVVELGARRTATTLGRPVTRDLHHSIAARHVIDFMRLELIGPSLKTEHIWL